MIQYNLIDSKFLVFDFFWFLALWVTRILIDFCDLEMDHDLPVPVNSPHVPNTPTIKEVSCCCPLQATYFTGMFPTPRGNIPVKYVVCHRFYVLYATLLRK